MIATYLANQNSKKTMQLVLLKGRLTTSITKEIITVNQDKRKFSRKPIRTWCKNKLFAKRARRREYKSRDLFWFAFDWSNRWREFSRPIKWRGTLKTNAIPGYQRHWSENCSIKLLQSPTRVQDTDIHLPDHSYEAVARVALHWCQTGEYADCREEGQSRYLLVIRRVCGNNLNIYWNN